MGDPLGSPRVVPLFFSLRPYFRPFYSFPQKFLFPLHPPFSYAFTQSLPNVPSLLLTAWPRSFPSPSFAFDPAMARGVSTDRLRNSGPLSSATEVEFGFEPCLEVVRLTDLFLTHLKFLSFDLRSLSYSRNDKACRSCACGRGGINGLCAVNLAGTIIPALMHRIPSELRS